MCDTTELSARVDRLEARVANLAELAESLASDAPAQVEWTGWDNDHLNHPNWDFE
jgi:hypothetical protein